MMLLAGGSIPGLPSVQFCRTDGLIVGCGDGSAAPRDGVRASLVLFPRDSLVDVRRLTDGDLSVKSDDHCVLGDFSSGFPAVPGAGRTRRPVSGHEELGWTLAGPTLLVAGCGVGIAADAVLPLVLGLIVGGAAVVVTLFRTVRNNGIAFAVPMYLVKLALVIVVVALVLLAFGAVPVDEKRQRVALVPSLLAAGALALFINGPRVTARRQAQLRARTEVGRTFGRIA